MSDKKQIPFECKDIYVSDLILDHENPRFVEILGHKATEEDLIKYMLDHENAKEIATNIQKLGYFYADEPLWVWKTKKGKYVVREGNRRFSAVKALSDPDMYLDGKLNKLEIEKLPCLIYSDETALDKRILEKHTKEEIKRWSRLAQAKYTKIMYEKGYVGQKSTLLKLSSFYTAAQKYGLGAKLYTFLEGEGKSAILERFFSPVDLLKKYCGFYFIKNDIEVFDTKAFKAFLNALIAFTKDNGLTAKDIKQCNKEEYLSVHFSLNSHPKDYDTKISTLSSTKLTESSGDSSNAKNETRSKSNESNIASPQQNPQRRGSTQKCPCTKRKKLLPNIKKIINELYNIDGKSFPNAKHSFARIVFENVLKYVLERTTYSDSSGRNIRLMDAKPLKNGMPKNSSGYINFTNLKNNFINIVKNKGIQNALKNFDLENMNQTIHNYNTKVEESDARKETDNLIPIIEFLLQEEADLIANLDTSQF